MNLLKTLGLTVLGFCVLTDTGLSQRGGGSRSGVRGAVAGGIVGGEGGAAKGAKIGVVTGVTRNAINNENTTRAQTQATAEYKATPQSNFNETPPDVLGVAITTGKDGTAGKEAVIIIKNKPLVGVTFPEDWKQRVGENYASAISKDGQAVAMFATLEGADKEAAAKKVKERLEKLLTDVKYDEPAETKGGAKVITGTAHDKKGVDVTFAAGIFEAATGQLVGAAFVVDSKIDEQYKETIRGICETIRRADDFNKETKETKE